MVDYKWWKKKSNWSIWKWQTTILNMLNKIVVIININLGRVTVFFTRVVKVIVYEYRKASGSHNDGDTSKFYNTHTMVTLRSSTTPTQSLSPISITNRRWFDAIVKEILSRNRYNNRNERKLVCNFRINSTIVWHYQQHFYVFTSAALVTWSNTKSLHLTAKNPSTCSRN